MIIGTVTDELDPVVTIQVRDSSGAFHDVEVVVDTGFTGAVSLTPALVQRLNLTWFSREEGILADGSRIAFDSYLANVLCDSCEQLTQICVMDGTPVIGMRGLNGFSIEIDVRPHGQVRIHRPDN